MITRKNGETHTQFISRLTAYIETLEANNRGLRQTLEVDNLINPRSSKSYQTEAQFMFTSLALIDFALRSQKDPETALIYVTGTLEELGFNSVQIYTNACLNVGAYRGEK